MASGYIFVELTEAPTLYKLKHFKSMIYSTYTRDTLKVFKFIAVIASLRWLNNGWMLSFVIPANH